MMIAVAFFAAMATLCYATADSVSTSLLLPGELFDVDLSFHPPTFVGQVTVTRTTTYYTLDCNAGGAANYFDPGDECTDNSYTFSEFAASTQYLLDEVTGNGGAAAAATSSLDELMQTSYWTVNCGPLGTSGSVTSATCTTTYGSNNSTPSVTETMYSTNVESSLYSVIFTTAAGYSAAATAATPSPTSPAATAKPTTTSSPKPSSTATPHPALGSSAKVGIGLGVPLGACALAGLALLLYRHGKHNERSRQTQMKTIAPPRIVASESGEGKRFSDAVVPDQTLGRQPPVYSMELQG